MSPCQRQDCRFAHDFEQLRLPGSSTVSLNGGGVKMQDPRLLEVRSAAPEVYEECGRLNGSSDSSLTLDADDSVKAPTSTNAPPKTSTKDQFQQEFADIVPMAEGSEEEEMVMVATSIRLPGQETAARVLELRKQLSDLATEYRDALAGQISACEAMEQEIKSAEGGSRGLQSFARYYGQGSS